MSADSFIRRVVDRSRRILGAELTTAGPLPGSALGVVTPVNSATSVVLTLPDAAAAWSARPFGLIEVFQKGVGVPSFAPAGSDSLRTPTGTSACVQFGMLRARVISSNEWALA